jgi:Histidine kinase-, DNA gyrase B-, and HSP90-like ATPase
MKSYFWNMEKFNFLEQSIAQLRKSIKGIDDSYNNEWDILAELTQNSVDAIKKSGINNGRIDIHVNCQNKSISILDNGCGISPDKLPYLLAPFSTDKDKDETSIGEKGVGLTFTIFSCNDFYIKTGNALGCSEGKVSNALEWKNSEDNQELPLYIDTLNEVYEGTFIELKKVKEISIFSLSWNQLKFVLRTKTAIGNTNKIWDNDINIEVNLTYTNTDGNKRSDKIDFLYWLITENLNKASTLEIDEFFEYIRHDRTDKEKRKKLYGKIIYKKGTKERGNRIIKYWSCLTPLRKTYKQRSIKNGLCTEDQIENANWLELYQYTIFQSTITASVKGMPTGIIIEHPITGAQGTWPQLFILIEDSQIKFDIGRKSIHGMQAKLYKDIAKDLFSDYRKLEKYIGADPDEAPKPEWDKNEIFASIDGLLDINYPLIKLKKSPKDQEASLVGLFYECIGNNIISDIFPLSAGYKRKYDLYAKWQNKQVVIEFKSKLQKILDDFESEKKMFDEIDCVVCWNVDEEDMERFQNSGINLEKIEHNELIDNKPNNLPSATHQLIMAFVSPIYVIDMKVILDNN